LEASEAGVDARRLRDRADSITTNISIFRENLEQHRQINCSVEQSSGLESDSFVHKQGHDQEHGFMKMQALSIAMLIPVSIAAAALATSDGTSADQDNAQGMPLDTVAQMRMPRSGGGGGGGDSKDFPSFDDVSDDYEKVISTTDGRSLYTIYKRERDAQMLAELPPNFEQQRLFIALTVASGIPTAGVQMGDMYASWKRFDKQLALVEPNLEVTTTGDLESRKGHDRVFTDRVILQVPIVCMGPGGGPVIDMDQLLLGQAANFFGGAARGMNQSLARIEKCKAFPQNVELAFELPLQGGRFGTLHYSISVLPENTGYQPREADSRIGYFVTAHMDIGDAADEQPWKRYINRWKLEKADPKLKLSPPKEPIIFYLEHTIPVRYRRWAREAVLEWNKAFEKVGIINAIEVYQQDARTGAHMDKDPEDVRYNFLMWTNANMGFAIGPSRVDPRTGQILDADIVMDEGFINGYVRQWRDYMPEIAMEGFTPQTLAWLEENPNWDPRVRLAPPSERQAVIERIQAARLDRMQRGQNDFAGHEAMSADPSMIGDDPFDGLSGRVSQINGACQVGMCCAHDLALFRMAPYIFIELAADEDRPAPNRMRKAKADDADDEGKGDDDEAGDDEGKDDDGDDKPDVDMLDGVPDWFIGPLVKEVLMHEVGHTLGLRHNFKASTVYSLKEIHNKDFRGQANCGSVMDYNPVIINFEDGPDQGDYTMTTIGPYDYWAIEYGYTAEKDLKPILARVNEEDLPYATDEDTWGPDPTARRFDFGDNSLDYADSTIRLTKYLRGKILDKIVKDGDSWAKARQAYQILLNRQFGAVSIAANWLGGSYVNRDKKGDPGDRSPIEAVSADQQRRALQLVIDNTFYEDAFGLTPELLAKMTVDKWFDGGGVRDIYEDPTWPVHDRILGMQAAAMTMLLNPTTLERVYDNEFRVDEESDALTVPEIIFTVADSAWSELDQTNGGKYTARQPMISSLRRNLQREHIDRMIDLVMSNGGYGAAAKPVSNLAVYKLRELSSKIEKALKNRSSIDPYTLAHLSEAQVRIDKALDAGYIYNIGSMGAGGAGGIFFGQPTTAQPQN